MTARRPCSPPGPLPRSLNPSLIDDADPKKIDPALDPFNPPTATKPTSQ
jgi:hypothetical protein